MKHLLQVYDQFLSSEFHTTCSRYQRPRFAPTDRINKFEFCRLQASKPYPYRYFLLSNCISIIQRAEFNLRIYSRCVLKSIAYRWKSRCELLFRFSCACPCICILLIFLYIVPSNMISVWKFLSLTTYLEIEINQESVGSFKAIGGGIGSKWHVRLIWKSFYFFASRFLQNVNIVYVCILVFTLFRCNEILLSINCVILAGD